MLVAQFSKSFCGSETGNRSGFANAEHPARRVRIGLECFCKGSRDYHVVGQFAPIGLIISPVWFRTR
ncbi:hypothetical protein COO20_13150 [Thalassospira marina]|uniref:Uncharacterized protein n=1 Tax=Thalassospira marina TaxID=2048283 RepID=A0A2N3KSI9_9PROT|nr:hypothetical protein COO20_13150 [Thalassospira marina]